MVDVDPRELGIVAALVPDHHQRDPGGSRLGERLKNIGGG